MSTQTSRVTAQLLEYIRDNNLQPGDPLPTEHALVENLGVSRSTLREAVRELRTLHIIEVRHGFGTFVGEASMGFLSDALVFRAQAPGRNLASGLIELIEVRAILEVGLAQKVAGHLTDDQIDRLYHCTELMKAESENSAADRMFHKILYENINNEIAQQLIEAFWDAFDQTHIALPSDSAVIAPAALHQGIIEAYRSGDVARAKEAMEQHFTYIRERLVKAQSHAL